MKTLIGLAALAMMVGCKVAATAEDYRWTIKSPASVAQESNLHFTVETTVHGGAADAGVPYVWKVQWVGVEGIRHQGYSYDPEFIRVKGGPGTAYLQILAFDYSHRMVEVARASFEVTSIQPPAR